MTDSQRIENLEAAVRLLAERCDQLLTMITEVAATSRDLTAELLRGYGVTDAELQKLAAPV
jgi:hypothetical protein